METMREKIADARRLINELEQCVCDVDCEIDCRLELPLLVNRICESMHMPGFKKNPLFQRTVACCRKKQLTQ